MAVEGRDLKESPLDRNPATFGERTGGITFGTETWNNYDKATDATWRLTAVTNGVPADASDPVVDLNHALRIDTKHNVRPTPTLSPHNP